MAFPPSVESSLPQGQVATDSAVIRFRVLAGGNPETIQEALASMPQADDSLQRDDVLVEFLVCKTYQVMQVVNTARALDFLLVMLAASMADSLDDVCARPFNDFTRCAECQKNLFTGQPDSPDVCGMVAPDLGRSWIAPTLKQFL